MKKYFLVSFLVFLLLLIVAPILSRASICPGATGLVPCGIDASCPCQLGDFLVLLARVYVFITKTIAAPLAVLMIIIGAVMIIFSAGFPNLAASGRKILTLAIIGLVLVLGSWIIVNWILGAVGYNTGKPWYIF